jgi:hypothetical protein
MSPTRRNDRRKKKTSQIEKGNKRLEKKSCNATTEKLDQSETTKHCQADAEG